MKRNIFILLFIFIGYFCNAQMIINGWFVNQGNPSAGPNLNLQGYGADATGSSVSDTTITVNTTSGGTSVGSLYWAINTAIGSTGSATSHKKIVFSVNGTITTDLLTVDHLSFVTIDGTGHTVVITSPNNDGLSFEGNTCNHIIVKNLVFANCGGDGANVVDNGATSGHDIAFMNCAFYGNGDGNIDIASGSTNVTVQYCVIGYHTSPSEGAASGGMLITGTQVSIHHNLFNVKSTFEGERCPLIHGNYSNAYADVRNNVVYNWGRDNATGSGIGTGIGFGGSGSGCGCYSRANIVNNYYYTISNAAKMYGISVNTGPGLSGGAEAYVNGNISGNNYHFDSLSNHAEWSVATAYQIQSETACQSVSYVLAHVGPDTKNSTTTTLISEVTNLGSCAKVDVPLFKMYKSIVKEKESNNIYSSNLHDDIWISNKRKSIFSSIVT